MNTLLSKSKNSLFYLLKSSGAFRDGLSECMKKNMEVPVQLSGLKGSLPSFFFSELVRQSKIDDLHMMQYEHRYSQFQKDFYAVVLSKKEADELETDINAVLGDDVQVIKFPWWETMPYRPVARNSIVFGERAGALAKLASKNPSGEKPRIFIFSERSLITPVTSPEYTRGLLTTIRKGQSLDSEELAEKLVKQGYTRVSRVGVKGEFALRGEVLDIFMCSDPYPFRIVFDFDTVCQIKEFEVEGQNSRKVTHDFLVVYPMKEVVWTDEFVSDLERAFEKEDSGGIRNDFASYDANRHGREKNEKNEQSLVSGTDTHFRSSGGEKEGGLTNKRLFDAGTEVNLALTAEAEKQKDRILTELSVNGTSEGEELFYNCLFERRYSVLDYLPDDACVFVFDWDKLLNAEKMIQNEYNVSYRIARQTLPVFKPSKMCLSYSELLSSEKRFFAFRSLETMDDVDGISDYFKTELKFHSEPSQSYFGNINYLKEQLKNYQKEKYHVYVYADNPNQALRVNEILKEFVELPAGETDVYPLEVFPESITSGFSIESEKIIVIQENEIFGRKKNAPASIRKAKSKPIETFVELNPGDYVVHVNYGIGLFKGIERVKAMGTERDYIKLEYADEEFIFVPIEQVNLVQHYIGAGDSKPKLDKIGSKSWSSRKAKVQARVEEIAEKLIDLYSKRKASRGFPFPKDTEWSAAFEAAFPYEDTQDQATATIEIKRDMERDVPMDRLVCGDVGYGKTEIAMRAAFKAVMGGKQVAFLAPTTILAEQHYENCVERFKNFPIKIAHLSRFVTPSEQKKVLSRLLAGDVDILVGTHRIIQKDVLYKDLGLLIIDEEQRFGVKDKEKLKVMKTNIDCLAMSATPIPRTLHMSLLKIRDMSLLTTPPQNRQSVETAIEEYNEEKLVRAIRNEISRGGQVFYLHNRVESLEEVRIKLEKLMPDLLVDVAHGQMTSAELDDIFRRFKMGGFHILVATTIIENGIDIPNVNTIIIDRADMYGVSQLYQLRGRVGRSDRKAYAYLFYPRDKALSEIAMKRLQVISDFTELGSGFKIAMKDMEIRGAGNLLGRDQSGEVYAIGFEMYLNLLNSAIERLSNSDWQAPSEVLLELEYTGFIPDSYIRDAQTKMELYKKIASIKTQDELNDVWSELLDRFGPLPDEVESLISLAKIRIICCRLSIRSLREKKGIVSVEFGEVGKINVDKVLKLIGRSAGLVRLNPDAPNQLIMKTDMIDLKNKSDFIKEKLEMLF